MSKETKRTTRFLTLGMAAKQFQVSKSTLHRDLKKGKVSASRDENEHYQIDQAELARHYKPRNDPERPETSPKERNEPPAKNHENSALEREVKLLREQNEDLKTQRDKWEAQSDKWQQQANQLLLMAPQKTDEPPQPKSWLARLLGK